MGTYRRSTAQRTERRRVTGRRHLDLVPTVTLDGLDRYSARESWLSKQRYQTGPRHGQELANSRKVQS